MTQLSRWTWLLVVGTLIFLQIFSSTQSTLVCPEPSVIWPCGCEVFASGGDRIFCENSDLITQNSVDGLFSSVRLTNNISSNEIMGVSRFDLSNNSQLTTLNLTSFGKTDFTFFNLRDNPKLTQFIIINDNDQKEGEESSSFSVEWMDLSNNSLTDEMTAQILRLIIHPIRLTRLDLHGNRIQGLSSFFDALASFSQLDKLSLGSNQVTKVGGGPFRHHGRLTALDLSMNGMVELGQNAFLVDEPNPSMTGVWLTIDLSGNQLEDDGIHVDNGLSSWLDRPTEIYLDSNQFEFFAFDKFHDFLYTHPLNQLFSQSNRFICDGNMKWLKDAREELEMRVHFVDCVNDPGKTIFTTNLVNYI